MSVLEREPRSSTMILDPEAAPCVTDRTWTQSEIARPLIRLAEPARTESLTAITTMAKLAFVAVATPAPTITVRPLAAGTDVGGATDDDDEVETDFVPLRRPPPSWSVAIDPSTPLVESRKPFIPPSMLEVEDD